jgi:hypothetical protein
MAENARSRAVSGSPANGRTGGGRQSLARVLVLIAQQRETGEGVVVSGSWARAGTPRYLLSRHRYAASLNTPTYRVGMAPINQYGFLIASLTCGEDSGMYPFRVRGNEDPAVFVDCAQRGMLVCSKTLVGQG